MRRPVCVSLKGRPRSNLVQSYGADFTREFEESPPGIWRAMQTKDGWRAMRLDTLTPNKPADFKVMKGVVLQDWKDAEASEQRTNAVRVLEKKYKIQFVTGKASAK